MKGHFKNILCVLNDTHKQDEVVAQAIHIAKNHQAELTIMLALEALPPNANMIMQSFSYLESSNTMGAAANDWLQDQIAGWSRQYPMSGVVCVGHSFVDIISKVVNDEHDLVIKLSESAFVERLFNSDDMHLFRKCPCPVWVIHRGQTDQYKNVVAAIDLNYHYPAHEVSVRKKLNLDILRYSAQIALLEFAQLHIVHVFDAVPENILRDGFISVDEDAMERDLAKIHLERENELERLLFELQKELKPGVLEYLQPHAHLVHGYPRREISATAKSLGADAIVMGTISRLGVPGFIMGGTAEETIQHLKCAVIGIKPEGFITPVNTKKKAVK
ncbi:universal stress protein [Alteromonas pelagimontana]|uniref:Universal stress protein n=2 Tax=Alteromonas pelagimontana TaxID=1858656 RepID=A0A6M4MI84_9ALTE|nr:universal stress protein [Alteromonas pelagimontana]